MNKDYLLLFLERRIFTIKSADDGLLQKLRAAVTDVVQAVGSDLFLAIPYTRAALDPETPINDPAFETVASAVQKQWNTYTEVFTEPRTVFRAIILDALSHLSEEEPDVAGSVDLITRNILPHIQSGGETEILTSFRDRVREISQLEAERQWPSDAHVNSLKLPSIKIGPLNGSAITINRDSLKAGFPRPAWNTGNWMSNDQQLLEVITNQGVEAIATTIEAAVKAGGISSDDLKKSLIDPLQRGIKDVVDSVSTSLASTVAPITTLKRQADLLWWKEAAFSDHLQQSYRTLPAGLLPLAFALDFASLLPPSSPLAVEHFLAEAFWVQTAPVTTRGKSTKPNLGTYLESLKSEARTSQLLNELPIPVDDSTGRSTLLGFVNEFSLGKTNLETLLARTGLSPSLEMTSADICLHLFRDIQALRLLASEKDGDAA